VTGSSEYHSLETLPGGPLPSKATLAPIIAILFLAPAAHAQGGYKREIPDSLAAKAKVSEAAAASTAEKRFPKGAIQGVELEREDGHLKYSYDIATPGKTGIDEVDVDALTGKIIAVSHETPAEMKKEAAEEANEAKAKAASPPAKPKKP
jgi:peptidase YpeB-like protein